MYFVKKSSGILKGKDLILVEQFLQESKIRTAILKILLGKALKNVPPRHTLFNTTKKCNQFCVVSRHRRMTNKLMTW